VVLSIERRRRNVFMGLIRCFYSLGCYGEAMCTAEVLIHGDRHFPGEHRLLAQAQKAEGDVEAAIKSMRQAVFSEMPWDSVNIQRAREYLKELESL